MPEANDTIEHDQEIENTWDVPKTRKCLTCRTPFESAWSGERICKRCKNTTAWKNGVGPGSF